MNPLVKKADAFGWWDLCNLQGQEETSACGSYQLAMTYYIPRRKQVTQNLMMGFTFRSKHPLSNGKSLGVDL